MDLYAVVNNQYIMSGMGDPIDLSIPAVKIVMDMMEIDNQFECLRKLSIIVQELLRIKRSKSPKGAK